MASLFRQNRFRSAFVLLFFICLVIAAGVLLPSPAFAADYPPAGSEITSLQGAYNQATDGDTIRTKSKTFYESLVLDRSINIILNGGYSDNSYTTTNGFTNLSGSLTITNGMVTVNNLVIGGNGGDTLAISNLAVTVPRITWTTDQLADSRIDYGETSSYDMSVAGSELSTSHSLVLSGLKPNTTYHYIVSSSISGASAATADNSFTTPDFIAATVADIGNSAVVEVSGNYDAKNADGSLNIVARQTVAQEYFKTHGDNIDFLVMFSTFDYAMPDSSTQGFYTAVKNNTQGINQPLFDNSSLYGSNSKLQGTIDMGNVSSLAANPYSEQLNQALAVLSHEFSHRFGAYVRYKLPDNSLSTALLGKDNAHWSYLLDSQGSVMYGNGWQDNGDGSFTSTTTQNSYSQLDLYLMGMIPKEQVPSMLLINNPAIDKTQLPALGATITGTASSISINDIVAAEGERIPNASTSQKQFNVGYILLVRHGDNIGQATQTLEIVRKAFAGRFAEMTQGIGSIANVPASLDLTIDTPADNATITGPSVQVTGTVLNSTGAETGVMVNGIPATVNGTRFIANGVDLQQGANTITATAIDINGLTSTAARTVTAQSGNYIRIRSNIESGIAPLDIALSVTGSFSISSSTLTSTGPVALTQLPGSTPTSYLIRLPVEGSYTLTVQATGPDGVTYEDSVTIIVLQKNRLSWLLKQKWEGIKAKISANDVEGAVAYMPSRLQDEYRQTFTALGNRLPVLSSGLPPLDFVFATNEQAKCRVFQQETILGQQKLVGYPVYFVREQGIWKLLNF